MTYSKCCRQKKTEQKPLIENLISSMTNFQKWGQNRHFQINKNKDNLMLKEMP